MTAGPPPRSPKGLRSQLIEGGLWGGGAVGGALMLVGALSPWYQIGGGPFVPSTCPYWFWEVQALAVVLAVAAFAGIVARRPAFLAIAGGATLPILVVSLALGLLCSRCLCFPMTGYSGPAYGAVIALAGSCVAIGAGILWAVRRAPSHS